MGLFVMTIQIITYNYLFVTWQNVSITSIDTIVILSGRKEFDSGLLLIASIEII